MIGLVGKPGRLRSLSYFPSIALNSVRLLQWLVFFLFVRPQSSPCMHHISTVFSGLGGTQRLRVRVPASAKNFVANLRNRKRLKGRIQFSFFWQCETFFEKIYSCLRRVSFNFFDIMQQTGVSESSKVSLLYIFGTTRHSFKFLTFRLKFSINSHI